MWVALARAAQAVMEITLFSLWYQGLFPAVRLSWPALFGLLGGAAAASYGLSKAMEALRARLLVRQAVFLAWLALALPGTLRIILFAGVDISLREMLYQPIQFVTLEGSEGTSFFHLLVMLLLFWRAVGLAGSPVSVTRLQVSFRLGLLGLLFYGIAMASRRPAEAIAGLFLYLFFALVSMSATRIASLADQREGRVPRFSGGWLAGIFLTGLGLVGLSVLAGWLASSRLVALVIQVLVLVLTFLTTLLLAVLAPLFRLLSRALAGLFDFLQRLFSQGRVFRLPRFLEDLVIEFARLVEHAIPGVLVGRGVLMAGLLLLILLAVLLGLGLRSRQPKMKEESDSGADGSPNGSLWRQILRRLVPNAAGSRLRSPGQMLAAARVRQIYRKLMQLSQKLGAGRPPHLTPLEYLPTLAELFPAEQAGLALITSAYVKVRYGEYPETLREVEAVQQAWDSIRRQARKKNQAAPVTPAAR
jgi:hypothetical protein